MKRNIDVVICASSDGTTCTGNAVQGWLIFADLNQDEALDTSIDTMIKTYEALPEGYTITKTDGTAYGSGKIIFYPDGSSNSPEMIYMCPQDKDSGAAWAIRVNVVGRITASHGDNGGNYQCTP